jgi:hypothetical protein
MAVQINIIAICIFIAFGKMALTAMQLFPAPVPVYPAARQLNIAACKVSIVAVYNCLYRMVKISSMYSRFVVCGAAFVKKG